ncbi:hypothetical protein BLNAU_12218 [Blattamonas nauphoetae]|uniref:B30.2/SPRY domain-containing protein n=1 Tax=Blattamonas nauphoetae TaxID=2049346 RepID=A0ABQ9XKE3_9EUKA|nr:hypothetical protein BLNAU_12218 [Blattamonas nauphoetae]
MTLSSTGTEDNIHVVSSVDSERLINHSPSSTPFSLSKSRCNATASVTVPLITLPPLLFTDPSHFIINETALTRSEVDLGVLEFARPSSALLRDPITSGIISVTITIQALPSIDHFVRFGVLDSTAPVPKTGATLGWDVEDSLSLTSMRGSLGSNPPSTLHSPHFEPCHSELREGDCVRIEVDMKSTPGTVQFFVNGESGRCYMSGLPPSVRIGFTLFGQGNLSESTESSNKPIHRLSHQKSTKSDGDDCARE